MSNLTTHLQSISESLGFKPSSIVVKNGIAKINFAQRDGSSGRLGVSLRKPLLDAGVTSDAITATADQVCVNFSQGANPARGTYPTSSGSSKLFSVQRNADGDYEVCLGEKPVRGGTVVRIGDRQSMMQELRELRGRNNDDFSREGGKADFASQQWEPYFEEEGQDALKDAELLKRKIKDKKRDLTQSESNIEEGIALMKKSLANKDTAGFLRAENILAREDRVRSSFSRTGAKAEFVTAPFHHRLIDLRTKINSSESLLREGRKIGNYSNCAATCESISNLYKEMKSVYLSSGNLNASRTGAKANNARPSLQEVMKSIDDYRASGASEAAVQQYSETVLRAWQAESGR